MGDLWAEGPLVLIFHPGDWSDDCALQLRNWERCEDALVPLGATLAVACLQDADSLLRLITAAGSRVVFLRDTNLFAAYGFGIAVPLLPEVVDLHASLRNDASVLGGSGVGVLPTPATYLIDQDGRIIFAHLAGHMQHVDPEDLVAMMQGLRPPRTY